MRCFLCIGSILAVCLLMFSPSLLADGVHSFTYRAGSDFDNSHFADANSASVESHSAFFESRTFGPKEDHVNWLGDFDDDHGKAWGWRNHHHNNGDNGWNSGDQGNGDTDGDSGNEGSTGSGDPSTLSVPEPSVLLLLSTASAALFLKSLRRATV